MILKSNLTGAKLIGIGRSVLLNRPLGFFVLPEYRSILNNFLKTVFESQTQENCELAIMKEDTEPLVVHVEAKVLNGTSECRIAVIDITEQTLIEKKLKESEELFRSLFETMTQGVVFLDATNRIISINPAGSRILNLPMNFIQGKKWPIPEWRLIREDGSLLPHNEQPSQIVFRHNKPVEDKIIGIIAPRIKNCIWLKINAVPQYSFGEKNSYQAFLIMEDITHLKRMETYNLLTKREKEVFLLMSKNLGRQTIANMLRIKVKTVDKHKENLMKKLSIYDVDVEEIVKFAKLIGVIK